MTRTARKCTRVMCYKEQEKCVVSYDEKKATFSTGTEPISVFLFLSKDIEVIGNIHENEELLDKS